MNKLLISLATVSLVACGGSEATDPELVDTAAAVSALSDDYGDSLEDVPVGSEDGAAEEALDDVEGSDVSEPLRECTFNAYRERVIAQYDNDGNGKIEGDELDALRADMGETPRHQVRWARQYRLQRLKWIYDADGDGALSDDERAVMVADLEARCEARNAYLLAQFDADEDGSLDASEWQVARQAMLQLREQIRAQVMAEFDLNDNGTLEVSERQAMMQAAYERVVRTRTALRAQFDANANGTLEPEELAALKVQLRARVRGEFCFGG